MATFEITNVSDETVKFNIVDYPSDLVKLRLPRVIKPGQTKTATVIIRPEALNIEFEKSFTFELRNAEKTRFSIGITRLIRD